MSNVFAGKLVRRPWFALAVTGIACLAVGTAIGARVPVGGLLGASRGGASITVSGYVYRQGSTQGIANRRIMVRWSHPGWTTTLTTSSRADGSWSSDMRSDFLPQDELQFFVDDQLVSPPSSLRIEGFNLYVP